MKKAVARRFDFALAGILLLAAALMFINIWKTPYSNAYYTAAVQSMLTGFHHFFYASFDQAGFVSVDKPPVGLWIQAAFAYVLGLHSWSVIMPQALAGAGSVWLLHQLIRPVYGLGAARLAALLLACTPIFTAVSRTNNVDSVLVLALLAACWLLLEGVRRDKVLRVIAAFGAIGIAFNIKMLQAYLIVPACILLYALHARHTWKQKLAVLGAGLAVMLLVSFSWAAAVDLTPKGQRPYVGSSATNSVIELAFGYNGWARMTGLDSAGNGSESGSASENAWARVGLPTAAERAKQEAGAVGPAPPGDKAAVVVAAASSSAYAADESVPGALRLFRFPLSAQTGPMLAAALIGIATLAGHIRRREASRTAERSELLFWTAWLVPAAGLFSMLKFFHPYYLSMLAPPAAAVAGICWMRLYRAYSDNASGRDWRFPLSAALAAALGTAILYSSRSLIGAGWGIAYGAAGLCALAGLFAARSARRKQWAAGAAAALLLAVPAYMSATPLLYGDRSVLPEAGPQLQQAAAERAASRYDDFDPKLLEYIRRTGSGGGKYLFATATASAAAPYMIESGKPVMAMGGFMGADPIVTPAELKRMAAENEVRLFLLPADRSFSGPNNAALRAWIAVNCREVPRQEWQTRPTSRNAIGAVSLYEVKRQR